MAGLSPASEFLDRLARCDRQVRSALLAERNSRGFWEGELSTSALATATGRVTSWPPRIAGVIIGPQ